MARGKYATLPDLFVSGTELVFSDNTVMWLQVLNPFEIDEARKLASAARSRYTLALREVGTDEYDAVQGAFYARPRDEIVQEMLKAKANSFFLEAQNAVTSDPEWAERLQIASRHDSVPTQDDAETELLEKINRDYVAEITKRIDDERAYMERSYTKMAVEDLLKEYMDIWLEFRAGEVGMKSFRVAEIYYGTRCCEAIPTQDGFFNERSHAECDGHKERVYDSTDEVRQLPEGLWNKLVEGYQGLAISERDARFSPRQESSSASSPLPSAEVESTPSTPDATSSGAPGT